MRLMFSLYETGSCFVTIPELTVTATEPTDNLRIELSWHGEKPFVEKVRRRVATEWGEKSSPRSAQLASAGVQRDSGIWSFHGWPGFERAVRRN